MDALSEQIADAVQAAIMQGRYRPGERIRQEDVATEFSASRFPVREALRILESRGLVTVQANRGARVIALSQQECVELYRMREQLEPLLLRDSVPRLTAEQRSELAELADRLSAAEGLSSDEYLELDRRFHELSFAGSDMSTVHDLVERLVRMTHHYRRAYRQIVQSTEGRTWILEYDHRLIADAVQRGDAEEAAQVQRLHTRRARHGLQDNPEVFAD
jgi:DNA-binding GntR family transcriptional regulator